jgi:hypothetical protein
LESYHGAISKIRLLPLKVPDFPKYDKIPTQLLAPTHQLYATLQLGTYKPNSSKKYPPGPEAKPKNHPPKIKSPTPRVLSIVEEEHCPIGINSYAIRTTNDLRPHPSKRAPQSNSPSAKKEKTTAERGLLRECLQPN